MSLLRPQTSGGIFSDEEFSDLSQSELWDNSEDKKHIATPSETNGNGVNTVQMMTSSGEYWQTTDQVIECIPVGKFHYTLLWTCGLALMADGMELSLLAFLSACARSEFDLSNLQVAVFVSIVFAGEFVGSLLFGSIADKYGRRLTFIFICSLIAVCGILSAFSNSFLHLLLGRLAVGVGVGGLVVPFDLLSELLPTHVRGTFLIYMRWFWALGSTFIAGCSLLFLQVAGWRVIVCLAAVPVLIAGLLAALYAPESPHWLLANNRARDAEATLRSIAKANSSRLQDFKLLFRVQDKIYKGVLEFCVPRNRKVTLPLWVIWFCFGVAYYGIVLLIGEMFERASERSNECNFNSTAIFLGAAAEAVGVLIASVCVTPWGRMGTQAALFAGAAVSALLMGLHIPTVTLVVVSIFARSTVMGASAAMWVATPELLATRMRTTGHAIANSFSRLGAFIAPLLVSSHAISNLHLSIIFALLNCVALMASFFLPETAGLNLSQQPQSKSQKMIDRANARLQVAEEPEVEIEMNPVRMTSEHHEPSIPPAWDRQLHDDISEITDVTRENSKHSPEEDGEEVYA